ncbi:MAG: DUF1987 domain-containing protein [Thermoguttaceae bacterium]
MAFKLERAKTSSTPYVLIDEEKSYFKLAGECFVENAVEFFQEIADWLKNFLGSGFTELTFDCDLEYFNSSTAKLLFNIISDIDDAADGKQVVINWHVFADDDTNIECGEDFKSDMTNAAFNVVIKQ